MKSYLLSDLQANISKNAEPEDWRYREAATTALGAILEGPSTERLAAYVSQGLNFLLHAMKDTHQQVRHSTAWTIGETPHLTKHGVPCFVHVPEARAHRPCGRSLCGGRQP